ncbi:MAG: hypothetical protein R8K20_04265, partial [Gallionellaceae bacterium]
AALVSTTLQSMLKSSGIDFDGVTYRAKSLASFSEKIQRKKYVNPALEMMDLAGIRVIVFIERDIKKVEELIQQSFNVHLVDSSDKSSTLGEDRFGYRSVHFVCDVGKARISLPEFKPFAEMQFEIQVRTVLQHAWAEIEHDRSYKLAGTLPSQLKRRLHLIAGLLELADREFSSLTDEIEKYALDVEEKAQAGMLEKVEVNSASVDQFLRHKLSTVDHSRVEFCPVPDEVIDELKDFGISTLDKLDALYSDEIINKFSSMNSNSYSFLRDAMMFQDIDRYFADAWNGHWGGMEYDDGYKALLDKYGREKVSMVLNKYNIDSYDLSLFS